MVNQTGNSGWPKRITVERRIVNLLSRSLYTDFPRAIREAVSNSFDADATVVKIQIDLLHKEIIIEDNGVGMSVKKFDNYLRIAGTQSEQGFSEKFGRKKIGRFGIGFLACFPFCDNLEITSKREGSDVGFTASIPTKRFVDDNNADEDISSIPIDGINESYSGKRYEHYTRIRMSGLTKTTTEYFKARPEKKRISIDSEPGMKRLRWQLSETLPLDFKNINSETANHLGNNQVGLEVLLNDEKLYRSDPGGQVLAGSGKAYIKLGNLEFKYVITTDWAIIHPVEARGIKVRLNGVGIGSRTYFEIEKESRTFSRLNWLSGEFNIIQGLDESLALTRDSFIWSPDYQALKDFFHTVLQRVHYRVENVANVERVISNTFSSRDIISPVSSLEVIDRSIKRLNNAGFEIVHKKWDEVSTVDYPIMLDKKKNVAVVIDDYSEKKIQSGETQIRYLSFGGETKFAEPIRLAADGIIELNTSYPIFHGKTKGDVLKRIHILMLMAKEESKTVDEMYDFLVNKIRETFE